MLLPSISLAGDWLQESLALIYNIIITTNRFTSLSIRVYDSYMNILEVAISALAPHICLNCAQPGSTLCEGCRLCELLILPSRCYRCHKATAQHKTCESCRRYGLYQVWAVSDYSGLAKQVIHSLKFARASASAIVVAKSISEITPLFSSDYIVTYAPTAQSRVRMRGYDQARLIAKSLARQKGLEFLALLERRVSSRQVGVGRIERFKQLEKAFIIKNPNKVKGANILVVDDVLTSGATLESAAKTLKQAGAKRVSAVVFAQA